MYLFRNLSFLKFMSYNDNLLSKEEEERKYFQTKIIFFVSIY